ncbi:hypothetical protein L227DRAFT_572885 [Lentinus tigrinus ALCF2SS1-6]|uniref:Uncharacterized protein n=2 Tax=Lentinus tigrinus TaxID=5365 RepID=A0A5C2SGX9_9APHY|nr:hypothetical protein L227DRAFT_572885 [Lentinus tigrinus ALCF2SS1-6]
MPRVRLSTARCECLAMTSPATTAGVQAQPSPALPRAPHAHPRECSCDGRTQSHRPLLPYSAPAPTGPTAHVPRSRRPQLPKMEADIDWTGTHLHSRSLFTLRLLRGLVSMNILQSSIVFDALRPFLSLQNLPHKSSRQHRPIADSPFHTPSALTAQIMPGQLSCTTTHRHGDPSN